jgi:site-specific DNA recombinase
MDESRLGREQIETAYLVKKITEEAGVRIFRNATDKVMLSLTNFAFEMEREQAQVRGRESARARAQKGHATGGAALGYRIIQEAPGVKRYVVDEDQAKIVRRIFELCQSKGCVVIANALNGDGVKNPCRRDGQWSATGVHEILFRETSRDVRIFGKTRWIDQGGTSKKVRVPEHEWIKTEAPEQRIVDEALWQAAHARLAQSRAAYLRNANGRLIGKPEAGLESRHLLSGMLVCGQCGSKLVAVARGQRHTVSYACYGHRMAKSRCPEKHSIPAADIHNSFVWNLTNHVLTPELLAECLADQAKRAAAAPTGAD